MIPYLLMLGVPAILALAGAPAPRFLLRLVAALYWVMIGFRLEVGMDWINYANIFRSDYSDNSGVTLWWAITQTEPAFGALNWLAAVGGGGLTLINAVSAFVFCWGFFTFAGRCREPWLAVTIATPLLVIAFAMSGVRQAMAIGIIFYLFAVWDRRGVVGRVALVIIASMFHSSALFILIFVALASDIPSGSKVLAVAMVTALIALMIALKPSAFQAYSELYVSGSRKVDAPGAIVQVLIVSLAAASYVLSRRHWVAAHKENLLLRHTAFAALLLVPATLISSVGAYRFALYFWATAMTIYSGWPATFRRTEARVLYKFGLVAGSILLLVGWLTFANSSNMWLPYKTILF